MLSHPPSLWRRSHQNYQNCYLPPLTTYHLPLTTYHLLLTTYRLPLTAYYRSYQNCDDAGADKVLFLLDSSSYEATSCVSAEAAELQGPALVLASSRPLSNDDLRRMKQLGDSQKRADFAKAGRFGLGLNSLYHMSDFVQVQPRRPRRPRRRCVARHAPRAPLRG